MRKRKRYPWRDPKTPEEWQEAVNLATGLRALADCKMYGLLEGGPGVDVARCDDIVERGLALGVVPSAPAAELAIEIVKLINLEGEA